MFELGVFGLYYAPILQALLGYLNCFETAIRSWLAVLPRDRVALERCYASSFWEQ
jgi:hypothetical protein